jgi:twitching motility protein PilT
VDPPSQPPILDLIAEGAYYKMQTFDQHLFELVRTEVISYDDAVSIASRPHDLSVQLKNAGVVT